MEKAAMAGPKEFTVISSPKNEREAAASEAIVARVLREMRESSSRWKDELSIVSFLNRCEREHGSEIARLVAESNELLSITSELLTV
jgi:hypothetical protein